MSMVYDVIIVGGGPAGSAAAVYTARKKLKTLLITEEFGGQSIVSDDIQNWIGEKSISGLDLAKKLEEHVRNYPNDVDVKMPERAVEINKTDSVFEVRTDKAGVYQGKTVILAIGARRRKIGVPGEDRLNAKGVSYCSTCDAPLFSGKVVAVIGGGNAGLEAAIDLFPYAKQIYLLEYSDKLKGDPITQEEVKENSKVEIIYDAQTLEIVGDKLVSGLKYLDRKNSQEKTLDVQGVFVEIGSVPNSEMVKHLVKLDQWGQVMIDSKNAGTSMPGIYAAGDVTDDPFKQNNISVGDAVKAALSAYAFLLKQK